MAPPNYFTCTLGQAAALNLTDATFQNIPDLIRDLAEKYAKYAAVGLAVPPASRSESQPWKHTLFTYGDLQRGSTNLALKLRKIHGEALKQSNTVALISPSTPEFMFTWLALMRLGLSVLLIAPQCQPPAIAHLCSTCDVQLLFHDEQYTDLATQSTSAPLPDPSTSRQPLSAVALPFTKDLRISTILAAEAPSSDFPSPSPNDVAYLHHTSGTSTGVPKPIPQSHRAGAGVLPRFTTANQQSSFTTTPLYHGGVADCFRTWTSGALIWLFPGRAPITARNVVACLDVADAVARDGKAEMVGYFSSVPYVLQSVAADEKGMGYLQNMDIVGVGGAALPGEVGDGLVKEGVNLISRFGSAECGFLMSSHRDYEVDKEWQYLRAGEGEKYLRFEKQDGGEGLVELVVGPGWPHMAKRNREDGSFATADLFEGKDDLPGAWRYHSRADSQLTLITGKKFDPAPLESAIATSDLLEDVLIFGNGQPYPGALLFRSDSAAQSADAELIEKIWPAVEKLNADSQSHARLLRKMLIPTPSLSQPLEKSSKGTIIRAAAEKRFATAISAAYDNADADANAGDTDVPDDQVQSFLIERIMSVTGKKTPPEDDADLFAYGVDSVAGMQIRNTVRRMTSASNPRSAAPPINVVEDCGTVERLAEYVVRARRGEVLAEDDDERQLMFDLVEKYSDFGVVNGVDGVHGTDDGEVTGDEGETIVLTGVTGALGAHLLDRYSHDEKVKRVFCLVRGADDHACRERVGKALEQKGLRSINDKVVILRSDLGKADFDLDEKTYARLLAEATTILHVAWAVNFRMRLRSFERDNIAGVSHMLKLAMKSTRAAAPRFGFCSSVASALSCSDDPIPETILRDPSAATSLGYSRSKWVAEQICDRAGRERRLDGKVVVFRVGQLSGDSHRGIWNTKEAWPTMLSAAKLLGSLPDLQDEALDWLPVDVAAEAIRQGMQQGGQSATAEGREAGLERGGEVRGKTSPSVDVMHVLNDGVNPKWGEMLRWLQDEVRFEIVSPQRWVVQLEERAEEDKASHPAFKLLELWKSAYGSDRGVDEGGGSKKKFAMGKTKVAVEALREVRPIDREYVIKMWRWIDANM